ncbi:MAG TPA: FadR/GntR family transcriptional regulator [Pseudonocardiaceae bacterium]|nr:FadR/GntR family transcriptional regulator [Pseudonocardiaceae bacterium]
MTPHRPRGVHGQTVEVLANRILSNELAEGAILDLPALREELDLSLTALREALKVLTAKGMIDARQKRGTFVRPRSEWNMLDSDVMRWQVMSSGDPSLFGKLTEVRTIVEPAAARMAADRATPADLATLGAALDRMAGAGSDTEDMITADVDFHRSLLIATHNEFLEQIGRVITVGLAERDKLVHEANPSDDPVPSHRTVFEAISAGNPGAAEAAMCALLDKAVSDLNEVDSAARRKTPGSAA